jgi:hypothetical protein
VSVLSVFFVELLPVFNLLWGGVSTVLSVFFVEVLPVFNLVLVVWSANVGAVRENATREANSRVSSFFISSPPCYGLPRFQVHETGQGA